MKKITSPYKLPWKHIIILLVIAFILIAVVRGGFTSSTERFSEKKNANYKLVYVSSPKCGFCTNFDPTWNAFTQQVKAAKMDNVTMEKTVDAAKYTVTGFPTVIMLSDDKQVDQVQGVQDTQGLWNMLRRNML